MDASMFLASAIVGAFWSKFHANGKMFPFLNNGKLAEYGNLLKYLEAYAEGKPTEHLERKIDEDWMMLL